MAVHTYTHMHACKHTNTCIHTNTHIHAHTSIHTHPHAHTQIDSHMYIRVHSFMDCLRRAVRSIHYLNLERCGPARLDQQVSRGAPRTPPLLLLLLQLPIEEGSGE
eukprot:GHVU01082175.1.p4 GENE.GHVU01082175.1~~GHVU01082175.1.p4  ORF type:complete len:106 (+),score=8.79 GHVU01082175.1:154-471(+)